MVVCAPVRPSERTEGRQEEGWRKKEGGREERKKEVREEGRKEGK